MFRSFVLAALGILFSTVAFAQEARFELGQRLRLFERALDKHPSAEARKRALEPLIQATPTFFKGQLGAAAGLLDRARLQLATDKPVADDVLWAESLVVRPAKRLLATSANEVALKIDSFYRVSGKQPDKVQLRWTLQGDKGKPSAISTVDANALPLSTKLTWKEIREGDYALRCEVLVAGKVCATGEQTVSLVERLDDRLAKLKKELAALEDKPRSVEKATLARLLSTIGELAAGRTLETNYPAHRLVVEAEALLAALKADKSYYGPARSGQFWLTLVSGSSSDSVRVQVPAEAKKGKPLPLVVAMHGAGGSENMFFDGYGDGLVAKLCARRGWLLVTTRTPLFNLGGGVDVPRVVDALARIYPVDTKKVVLIGHSMGAAQAVAAAGRTPERFRAVAALGGGGGFRASEEVKGVRFFVGCGERDFALGGARNLHRALVKGGVKKATFKAYDDVEHLIIVQLALPDVFRFFDETIAEPGAK